MTIFTCQCIIPGCTEIFKVSALNRKEAVSKVIAAGEDHNFDRHPEMPMLSTNTVRLFVAKHIKVIE